MSSCSLVSVVRIAQSRCQYIVTAVNDVIDDKNAVTKFISKSTGLQ